MAIGTGITCDLVQIIDRNECIGNSLPTLNTNFVEINNGLCELTNYAEYLTSLVDTVSARLALTVKQLVPVGSIQTFSYQNANPDNLNSVLPFGWYPCEGQIVPISTHLDLAKVLYIGNSNNSNLDFDFGYKCTATGVRNIQGMYIKLPDLRGYFVRGHGTNSDGIKSHAFGKKIADTFQGHHHDIDDPKHAHTYTEPNGGQGHKHKVKTGNPEWTMLGLIPSDGWWVGSDSRWTEYATTDIVINDSSTNVKVLSPITDKINGVPRVDFETRPRNIALQFGIKWYNEMI